MHITSYTIVLTYFHLILHSALPHTHIHKWRNMQCIVENPTFSEWLTKGLIDPFFTESSDFLTYNIWIITLTIWYVLSFL